MGNQLDSLNATCSNGHILSVSPPEQIDVTCDECKDYIHPSNGRSYLYKCSQCEFNLCPSCQEKKLKQVISSTIDNTLSDKNNQSTKPHVPYQITNNPRIKEVSYHDASKGVFGCRHYARNCWIKPPCCNKWYVCRFCHDDDNKHSIDRHSVEFIRCMRCDTVQKSSKHCTKCIIKSTEKKDDIEEKYCFGRYYCGICNYFDDAKNKEIFHCSECGICMRGNRMNCIHCSKCKCCYKSIAYPNHSCINPSRAVKLVRYKTETEHFMNMLETGTILDVIEDKHYKYDEDVIQQLVQLELGTRDECIKASSMVSDYTDINAVAERLTIDNEYKQYDDYHEMDKLSILTSEQQTPSQQTQINIHSIREENINRNNREINNIAVLRNNNNNIDIDNLNALDDNNNINIENIPNRKTVSEHDEMLHNQHNLESVDSSQYTEIKELDQFKLLKNVMQSCVNNNSDKANIDIWSVYDSFLYLKNNYNDDEEFEYIYNELGGCCDAEKCQFFKRNYMDRSCTIKQAQSVWTQIIDIIHCYYRHTFDMGYKLNSAQRRELNLIMNDDEECDECDEKTPIMVNKQIIKKKQLLSSSSISPLNPNRSTKFSSYHMGQSFCYENLDQFHYPDHGRPIACRVFDSKAKYKTLKHELTQNELATLTMEQYINEYEKAKIFKGSYYCKENYTAIELEMILSLMIYCNYTNFQYIFSKTYRENIHEHYHFYHLGKTIKAAISQFGTNDQNHNYSDLLQGRLFYHGISEKLLFNTVGPMGSRRYIQIFGPLSTTTSFEVALNFANNTNEFGLIVSFRTPKKSRYFQVDWLSDFQNERECLFIQEAFGFYIANITDPVSGTEYECILSALGRCDMTLNNINAFGQSFKPLKGLNDNMKKLIVAIINYQLSIVSNLYFDEYAKQMINDYFVSIKTLKMDLNEKRHQFIIGLFFDFDKYFPKMHLLQSVFPNATELHIKNWKISDETLKSFLMYINSDKINHVTGIMEVFLYPEGTHQNVKKLISLYKGKFVSKKYSLEYNPLKGCVEIHSNKHFVASGIKEIVSAVYGDEMLFTYSN